MPSKQQFSNSLFRAIAGTAALATALALAVVPVLAQSAVPPTARQAASNPAFASRLAHQAAAQKAGKARAVVPSRRARTSPQGQLLYDNGPFNGTTDAWTINFGFSVSNSFTVPQSNQIQGFHGVFWLFPGDGFSSVDIDFGSTSFGSDLGHVGGVTASGFTDLGINQYGYDLQEVWFDFGNITVPYWVYGLCHLGQCRRTRLRRPNLLG